MENQPLVSVIMPTYNGEKYVESALLSVLMQDYPNIEILVCDDKSTDGTLEYIQEFKHQYNIESKVKLIQQTKNQGISKNMNTGLEVAKGKYIAICDQDDFRKDPSKTQKQVSFLEQNEEHKILGTNAIFDIYGAQQKKIYPMTDSQIRKMILGSCPMLHSSVMYDKELSRKVGGYSESYKYAMDYKLFLDLMKYSKGANLADETTYYRRHGNNTSILKSKEQQNEAIQIKQEHKNNFPNGRKNIVCYKTVRLLNEVFGDNPLYVKLKNKAKEVYFKAI